MNRFTVEKAENGFLVSFEHEVISANEKGTFTNYDSKMFVFDTPAKLKRGVKALLEQLTEKGE